ncbi:copper amine oxidase [Lysinibacillus sphaericus]|uniref:leucine-rich repeat domain-containing protein n=1 Tax=Lysinibacillus sphaericus TaxID=1421 RepID=UPI0018CC8A99|nr:leucine-rich repeat domain-containing protein [Lysinibacillus sphaericus]MBG9455703.1 copper amine oxidase [Lysinibacillus sphaericus]MBG9477722.1 copper amine oxidase [Lysinibacillus sphaericus]MBG9593181.1 copper amine oxidase [Lysinibacillus sphaericus]
MMKRFTVFLLIIVLCTSFSIQIYAEEALSKEVVFADPNLETAIKSLLKKTSEEAVTKLDLETLTDVNLSDKEIKSLQGLEYATNITQLKLSYNHIADISPLKGLTKIRILNLTDNQISSIEDLSAMKELETLHISNNQISSLDAVKQLPCLLQLFADRNQISNVQGLSNAIELNFLDLSYNKIENIAPLSNLWKLTDLYVGYNQIHDLTPLRVLTTNLKSLSVNNNRITDIKPLETLFNLKALSLSNNKITDIKPLEKLVDLTSLIIGSNNITDIKPLAGLVNLGTLNASDNNIKDIAPLSKLVDLIGLGLSSNQIYDLEPLRNMKRLVTLDLNNNRIWNLEPIQDIKFSTSYEYESGVELYNNNLDMSPGTKAYKIFLKVTSISDYEKVKASQRKTQRLIIGSTTAYVGDSAYRNRMAPFIYMDRTYVPIRFVSEQLGANVGWNQSKKEVTIQKNGKSIRWTVGNKQVQVNQQTMMFDSPLLLRGNTTFVPIRFVSEQLNTSVEYIGSRKMVIIFENEAK